MRPRSHMLSESARPRLGTSASWSNSNEIQRSSLDARLDQVPEIAIKVLKHCDCPVRLLTRLANEGHALSAVSLIVPHQVIRVQEQKYATAGLVADVNSLFGGRGSRQ